MGNSSKRKTVKQKTGKWKRALALTLAATLVTTLTDWSAFDVKASTTEEENASACVITDFDELPEEVAFQRLAVGSTESDIIFPTELTVTIKEKEDQGEEGGAVPSASVSPLAEQQPSPEAAPEEGSSPSPTADINQENSAGPENSAEPESSAGPGNSAEPERSAEPGNSAEPERSAEPGNSAKPESSAEPGNGAEPESSTEPGAGEENSGNVLAFLTDWKEDLETAFALGKVQAAGEETLKIKDIQWEMDDTGSEDVVFPVSEEMEGTVYVYHPILPGEYLLEEGVKLPEICVEIGAERILITQWQWEDTEENLDEEGELIIPNPGDGTMLTFEVLTELLPCALTGRAEGREEPVRAEVVSWSCEEFVQDEETGLFPTAGEFTFAAQLEEGFEAEPSAEVTVQLMGVMAVYASSGTVTLDIKDGAIFITESGYYRWKGERYTSGEMNWGKMVSHTGNYVITGTKAAAYPILISGVSKRTITLKALTLTRYAMQDYRDSEGSVLSILNSDITLNLEGESHIKGSGSYENEYVGHIGAIIQSSEVVITTGGGGKLIVEGGDSLRSIGDTQGGTGLMIDRGCKVQIQNGAEVEVVGGRKPLDPDSTYGRGLGMLCETNSLCEIKGHSSLRGEGVTGAQMRGTMNVQDSELIIEGIGMGINLEDTGSLQIEDSVVKAEGLRIVLEGKVHVLGKSSQITLCGYTSTHWFRISPAEGYYARGKKGSNISEQKAEAFQIFEDTTWTDISWGNGGVGLGYVAFSIVKADTKYALTLSGGGEGASGGGSYLPGEKVTVKAGTKNGYGVAGWRSTTGSIADTTATITYTMPYEDVTLTPVFKRVCQVTVKDGTVESAETEYLEGMELTLVAEDKRESKQLFKKWELIQGTGSFSQIASEKTVFTLEDSDVEIQAVYEPGYDLTVENGSTDSEENSFCVGSQVTLTAKDRTSEGLVFKKWEIKEGQGTLEDQEAEVTVFTTGAEDTSLCAVYVKGYTLTVENGTGDGFYYEGQSVEICAEYPAGHQFVSWYQNGSKGTFADRKSEKTRFVMGAESVVVTADYFLPETGDFLVTGGVLGTDYTYQDTILSFTGSGSYTVTMRPGFTGQSSCRIQIAAGSPTLTLHDVQIACVEYNHKALEITEDAGAVTLKLSGSSLLQSGAHGAGIHKVNEAKLTITSVQGDGSSYGELIAKCVSNDREVFGLGAGIGMGPQQPAQNITIAGGTVKAYGGTCGAGIGGGAHTMYKYGTGNGENITITGGTVEAYGGERAAGIGGGEEGYGIGIVITGGTVTAIGGTETREGMTPSADVMGIGRGHSTQSSPGILDIQGSPTIKQGESEAVAAVSVSAADVADGTKKYIYITYDNTEEATLKITPEGEELYTGETQTFVSEVTGNDKTVIWKVTGAQSEDTAISQGGLLTIGENEKAEALTIEAVLEKDSSVTDSVRVTVKQCVTPEISSVPIASGLTYGQSLGNSTLTGGSASVAGKFSWADKNQVPEAGNTECEAVFTPSVRGYSPVRVKIQVKVEKAQPTVAWKNDAQTLSYTGAVAQVAAPEVTLPTGGRYTGGISYRYKNADGGSVTEGLPTDAGTYLVYAVVEEQSNYKTAETADPLTLTISRLQGSLTVDDQIAKIYGEASFPLKITKTGDGKVSAEVTDSYDAKGIKTGNEQVVTVTEAGMVTITGTGRATIKVTMSEGINYTGANSSITVTVSKKAAPSVSDQTEKYVYTVGTEGERTWSLCEMLPEDRGVTTYVLTTKDDSSLLSEAASLSEDGGLSCTIAAKGEGETSFIGKNTVFTVTATMAHYQTVTFSLTLVLEDKRKPEAAEDIASADNGKLVYGEKLSAFSLEDVTFKEPGLDVAVAGSLSWKNPEMIPEAGKIEAEWIFVPRNSLRYQTVTGKTEIQVQKAVPRVETQTLSQISYAPARSLSAISLPVVTGSHMVGDSRVGVQGTLSWKNGSLIPTAGNKGYEAVFTPDDDSNYDAVDVTVTLPVSKAIPVISGKPAASMLIYGQSLSESTLSGGAVRGADGGEVKGSFSWKEESKNTKPTVVADSGKTLYPIEFIPEDTVNWEEIETTVTVEISKAQNAPNLPEDVMTPDFGKKVVGEVPLPAGWVWEESGAEQLMPVGEAVRAFACYKGSDMGNYLTERVEITLIRSPWSAPEVQPGGGGESDRSESPLKTPEMRPQNPAAGETEPQNSQTPEMQPQSSQTPEMQPQSSQTPEMQPQSSQAPESAEKGDTELSEQPHIQGEDEKKGWEAIREELNEILKRLEEMPAESAGRETLTVTVEMNGSTVVPDEILETIRGRDLIVVFDMGDGITWSVNGKSITGENIGDINFKVEVATPDNPVGSIPIDVINNVTGERYSINITLAHKGEFGFEAVLSLNMESKNSGLYANLFYYNEETGELEFICYDKIKEDGTVHLTFSHASDYTIIVDKTPMDGSTGVDRENSEAPAGTGESRGNAENGVSSTDSQQSGGSGNILWIVLILAAAAAAAVGGVIGYRKKKGRDFT